MEDKLRFYLLNDNTLIYFKDINNREYLQNLNFIDTITSSCESPDIIEIYSNDPGYGPIKVNMSIADFLKLLTKY